jgi:dTDP-glucose 4,6-dehydratase
VEASQGRHLPLYGKGVNIRNWVHVEDNCRAILTVVEHGEVGGIYNIGGDNYIDNLSLSRKLLELMNCPENLIKFVSDRPGHDLRYAIDTNKIGKLGWAPRIDFEKGLKQTIDWYLQNREWWQNILSGEHLRFYQNHYRNR